MLKNIDCRYSLEPPRRGGSNEYHNLCFEQKYEKYQRFLSEKFQFLEVKFSIYLNRHVFVMASESWRLTINVCGRAKHGPVCGFLVLWPSVAIEPIALFHHRVLDNVC